MKRLIVSLFSLFFLCPLNADVTVSGNPSPLTVNSATAGSDTNMVIDTSTTYSVGPIGLSRITGQINTSVPTGTTLFINLAAPPGATSFGDVALTTTPQNLVTGILLVLGGGPFQITYKFSAPVAAGVVASTSRTVTLTLVLL